jgi:hypothetical protein
MYQRLSTTDLGLLRIGFTALPKALLIRISRCGLFIEMSRELFLELISQPSQQPTDTLDANT